ncbi:hypothetical protein N1031_06775 [Herbiconiux moechotypicola]|uniref:Uncharacterized protein n=1 Tax=Herbiconiux moechotypicola TaxID=637393 RepID=A0ABN3DFT7_9MICO|nr:hypothetical protein [Herbiconiux moechotypicola]MCS5729461.1 hypothetical protein [Herbiconiux moechotypicola]
MNHEIAQLIETASIEGQTLTIRKTDGRTFTGVPSKHPTDPALYTLQTGRRGRPAVIHPEDVEEVFFE